MHLKFLPTRKVQNQTYIEPSSSALKKIDDFFNDNGSTLFVSGPAGVGKTTFIQKEILTKASNVFYWKFNRNDKRQTDSFLRRLVLFALDSSNDVAFDIQKINFQIQNLALQETYKDELKDILGIQNTAVSPLSLSDFRYLCVLELLEELSQAKDLLLVFEDLHYQSSEFDAFLKVFYNQKHSFSLVLSSRNKNQNIPPPSFKYTEAVLKPWGKEKIENYLGVGSAFKHDQNLLRLVNRANGNPFLLSQVKIIEASSSGQLDEHEQLSLRTNNLSADNLILFSTYKSISHTQRRILEIASYLGYSFENRLFAAVCDEMKVQDSAENISNLLQLRLIKNSYHSSENILEFNHDIFYSFIKGNQNKALERKIYTSIFRVLRKKYFKGKYLELLAKAAEKIEKKSYACFFLTYLTRETYKNKRFDLCNFYAGKALDHIEELSTRSKLASRYVPLAVMKSKALHVLGEYKSAVNIIDYLVEKNFSLNFEQQLDLSMQKTMVHWIKSELSSAVNTAQNLLIPAEETNAQITKNTRLGAIYAELGDFQKAIQIEEKVLKAIPEEERESCLGTYVFTYPAVLSTLSRNQSEVGNFEASMDLCDKAQQYLNKDKFTDIYIASFVGLTHNNLCQFEKSSNMIMKTLENSQNSFSLIMKPFVYSVLASSLGFQGKFGKANSYIYKALKYSNEMGQKHKKSAIGYYYLEYLLLTFQKQKFQESLREEKDFAFIHEQFGTLAWLNFLEAIFLSFYSSSQEGLVGALSKAYDLSEKNGMYLLQHNLDYLCSRQEIGLFDSSVFFKNKNFPYKKYLKASYLINRLDNVHQL